MNNVLLKDHCNMQVAEMRQELEQARRSGADMRQVLITGCGTGQRCKTQGIGHKAIGHGV